MERIVPGLLIAGFWLFLLLKGSLLLFSLVIVLIVFMAAVEYVKMADGRETGTAERWLLSTILTLPVIATAFWPQVDTLVPAGICSFLLLTGFILYRYKELTDRYNLFCRLIFGQTYIGLLAAHLILLRVLPDGGSWLIIASAITAGSDSGAYFFGRAMGKRKLCPNVSPNKTVEGAVGGVICGLLAAIIFALLLLPSLNWLFLIVASLLLAGAGIVGDLTESIIKRGTATKDSGSCLAGHGGILDRVDSLLFVCPILYYLLVFLVI